MVNFSPINCSNNRAEDNQKYEKLLNEVFKYTSNVNAHVLYNFKAPTNQLGEYDHILFVDIPYAQGNYYRTPNKVYLNTLAIAVRTFEEPEVIDVDESCFYTEDGSWEYVAEMESDRQALRSFVYDNIPNVKHFDIAMVYKVNAPNCHKEYQNEKVYFNTGVNIWQVINNAIEFTKNKGVASNCIVYNDKDTANDWSCFLSSFIDITEKFTKHGILTKRKIDYITKKKISRLLEQANQAIGQKLCIIRGKAGTGKTLSLLRLMYEQVRKGEDAPKHNCRLLTFNNMLVMDLKMVMKGIGDFTPTKASISTLHKFFYDIYKVSPVRYLHMDAEKINSLFNLCFTRILKFNSIIQSISAEKNQNDISMLINTLNQELMRKDCRIKDNERSEWEEYQKYLLKKKEPLLSELMDYTQEYIEYKRKVFLENYHRQAFLNGYNVILEELYLIFHNLDDFMNKYNMKLAYSLDELRNSEDFKTRYQEIYNQFLNNAGEKLKLEYGEVDDIIPGFIKNLEELDRNVSEQYINRTNEEQKEILQDCLKKIKRKVNWSKLIIVDEAQDCQINEKALLLELNGSDNTVIATGGKDQLIRTAKENDWSQLFGKFLDVEKITLKNVSFRQKGNIILFINEFASSFNIETRLSVPDETENAGRVIIDCRKFSEVGMIPIDIVNSLHLYGKDMGCSNFENIMFLLPQIGFVKREKNDDIDVSIDSNNTILISQASARRFLNIGLPKDYNPIDGTINDKREALKNVGQGNTRCLLYESCRGLEAWNVMCMNLNDFYYDKMMSKDAKEYAESNTGGLFEVGQKEYMIQYAALWCYMAMTRAIDTLYIKLSNTENDFSRIILKIAHNFSNVEVLEGTYNPSSKN